MSLRSLPFSLIRLACLIALLAVGGLALTAQAQTAPMRPAPGSQPTPQKRPDDDVDFASRQDDARTRLQLRAEKKAYQEHLARAKEASDLAAQLEKTYDAARVFNAADLKKLERLEKLMRRIRNEVGGSQTDTDPKDLPRTIDEAVTALAKSTKDLHEEVEQTPRRIVSASIIEQANKLIALIQHLRGDRD